jgi:VCBS repeat-containing protein
VRTAEDLSVSAQLLATDVDGPALTYRVKSPAAHGDATVDAKRGAVTYKPTADFNGSDVFAVEVSDGQLSAAADVSVTVSPVNDAPVASAATFSTDEDAALDEHLEARDVEADTLTYALGDKPRHGEATVDAASGRFHYVPSKNFEGDDAFGFVVSDGKLSAAASITLHIKPVDDAPVARPLSLTTLEDSATKGQIVASDLDGPALSYRVQTPPLHGTATVNAETGSVSYKPAPDFNGSDPFVVEVSDGQLTANANVTVTVTPVNDQPRTQTTAIEVNEDTPIEAKLPGYDVDGDTLTFHILSAPRLGTAVLTNARSGRQWPTSGSRRSKTRRSKARSSERTSTTMRSPTPSPPGPGSARRRWSTRRRAWCASRLRAIKAATCRSR